ncbi:MAG: hypothetical protein EOM91_01555 [Sphingobacteriia bacterium]|nr:hypothetical protein [Sphingobacteriia bacterium]
MLSIWLLSGGGTVPYLLPDESVARFFRWSDELGTVHYSDHVPPEQAVKGHVELNQQGIEIRQAVPPQPPDTTEEAVVQSTAETLRQAADAELLRTARTRDELLLMRDGKLAEIDALVQVSRDKVRRERASWGELTTDSSAETERSPPSAAQLNAALAESEPRILDAYHEIIALERRRAAFQHEITPILKRFEQHRDMADSPPPPPSGHAGSLVIIPCASSLECGRLQTYASRYLQEHLDKSTRIVGDKLLVLIQNDSDERRHMTLAALDDLGEGGYLVLDLQCRQRLTSDVTCRNPEALRVVAHFRDRLEGADPAEPVAPPASAADDQ